jgi:biotin carboxylase
MNDSDPHVGQRGCVIVLPGSDYQVPLLKKVRSRGYRVVCADHDAHCACSTLADEFHVIGLNNRKRLLDLGHRLRPAGIVTDQTDSGVAVVAWLSEQLDLRGIGTTCAHLFTNKHAMRIFGRQLALPTPTFRLCANLGEAVEAARSIGFPVIVKPPGSQSSRGVGRADDDLQLRRRLVEAQPFSATGEVLVEQFIGGTEFTVEGVMTRAGHVTLGISEKSHYADAPMVACRLCYTPYNSQFDYAALRKMHDRLINASGLPFGLTHAEYKCWNGEFYLIETAARGGGSRIASIIVPWISGIDYHELLLDEVLIGQAPIPSSAGLAQRCALLEFFTFPPGRVRAICGLKQARQLPGVFAIILPIGVGDVLQPVTDDTKRPGMFILLTENAVDLQALRERVLAIIRLDVDPAPYLVHRPHYD